ncbi:microtubule-associated protein 1A [Momordica charantia]|uniref:Microtubule-associated protein 1A n=1 Tax=Momordica charantia TaxID=3673 RepID=A0A6J1CJ52_MOMCH|nr:microtubule-associated protein 1A [Momordica charantia]
MSQFNHMQTYGGNASPAVEQLFRDQGPDASRWPPSYSSPSLGRDHDPEEDIDHHQKKSVFTKVKEKAKKLRYTLSNKKKHGEDENPTPSWGYNLDEDEEEDDGDAEYLGAPMYESELAPEDCKENARQHPRADPVIAENHVLANTIKLAFGQDEKPFNSSETSSRAVAGPSLENRERTSEITAANSAIRTTEIQENEAAKPHSPGKTLTEAVTEKLAPVYSTVTDATHAIASKIHSLTVSAPSTLSVRSSPATPEKASSPANPRPSSARTASQASKLGKGTEQIWDKGVSVKEYLMHKFEPGEDERALSQVLSNALSPRTNPRDVGVVEKMKEAVNSMLRAEDEPEPQAAHLAVKSSSRAEKAAPETVAASLATKSLSQTKKAPEPVAVSLATKSSSQTKKASQPMAENLAAKPSSQAEKAPKEVTTHLAKKSSSQTEKAPQAVTTHLASKSSSQTEKAPQAVTTHLAAKSSSQTEKAPQAVLAVHVTAKPASRAEPAPQAILTTNLAAKPSSRVEAAPQPVAAHLTAKSSSNAPTFTTAHRVAEEENLERILQTN